MPADLADHGEYYRSYGLDRDPFPVGHVDDVYFATPELEHRLELVRHLIDFSDRTLLVTAGQGVGKTAFMQRLQFEADDRWKITRLAISGKETVESLLAGICEQNHLDYRPGESVSSTIEMLDRHFRNNISNNLVNVFLVDDADQATAGVLNLLLQLSRPQPAEIRVQLVMFSAEDISALFRNQDNEFVHKMELPLLAEEQLSGYLQHRLDAVDFDRKELFFTDDRISQIYKTTAGNPQLINQLAARVLQEPSRLAGQSRQRMNSPLLKLILNGRITLIIALLLAATFVVIILNREDTGSEESISLVLPDRNHVGDTSPLTDERTEIAPVIENETKSGSGESTPGEEMPAVNESLSEVPAIQDDTPVVVPESPAVKKPERIVEPESGAVVAGESAAAADDGVSAANESPAPDPQATTVTIVEPEEQKNTAPAGETVALAEPRGSAWLNQQSPEKYVLQIMGAHDPGILTRLLSTNPSIKARVARFTTVNDNKPWHVLVYGLYADHDAAVADIAALPDNVRALGPWPRTIASIQDDLR
jgi:DamX protein